MNTNIHSINLPKIMQIGWGHHVDFCVWKNRPLLLTKGVLQITRADHLSNIVSSCKTSLLAHSQNLKKILFALISIIIIQPCYNFAHATTAQLSWHCQKFWPDLIIICGIRATRIFYNKLSIMSSYIINGSLGHLVIAYLCHTPSWRCQCVHDPRILRESCHCTGVWCRPVGHCLVSAWKGNFCDSRQTPLGRGWWRVPGIREVKYVFPYICY